MAEASNGAGGPAAGAPTSTGSNNQDLSGPASNENTETAANENAETKQPYRLKAKLKVDGKEEDIDLSEEDIVERLQRQRAYERKEKSYRDGFAEIEKAKKALAHLKSKPVETLLELGVDVRALAKQVSAQEEQLNALTPEQRMILERDMLIAQLQQQQQQQQQAHEQAQQDAYNQAVWNESQPRIVAAMEAAGMPRTPEAIRMYAVVGKEWLERGYDAPEAVIAKEASDRLRSMSQAYQRNLTPDQLVALLGEETVRNLTQHLIKQAQATRAKRQAAPKPTNGTHAKEEPTYVDEAEFRRRAGL